MVFSNDLPGKKETVGFDNIGRLVFERERVFKSVNSVSVTLSVRRRSYGERDTLNGILKSNYRRMQSERERERERERETDRQTDRQRQRQRSRESREKNTKEKERN